MDSEDKATSLPSHSSQNAGLPGQSRQLTVAVAATAAAIIPSAAVAVVTATHSVHMTAAGRTMAVPPPILPELDHGWEAARVPCAGSSELVQGIGGPPWFILFTVPGL